MRPADADEVLAIYQAGLDTGQTSFETAAPTWAAFDAGRLSGHRLVAVSESGVLGSSVWTVGSRTSREPRNRTAGV